MLTQLEPYNWDTVAKDWEAIKKNNTSHQLTCPGRAFPRALPSVPTAPAPAPAPAPKGKKRKSSAVTSATCKKRKPNVVPGRVVPLRTGDDSHDVPALIPDPNFWQI